MGVCGCGAGKARAAGRAWARGRASSSAQQEEDRRTNDDRLAQPPITTSCRSAWALTSGAADGLLPAGDLDTGGLRLRVARGL
jgi:hypothetical protein